MDVLRPFEACNLCGSQERQRIARLKGDEKYLELCKRCSLFFLNVEELEKAADSCQEREVAVEASPFFQESLTHFFEDFFQRRRLRPGKVLDIGCGTGLFLVLAREKGWDVQGIEISRRAAETARSQYGLPVLDEGIEKAFFPDESFDLITFWNSLDYMADPQGALKRAHRFLKRGGLVLVRVTNIRFHLWIYRLWFLRDPERGIERCPAVFHVYNFSETTLKRMLEQGGFKQIRVRNSVLTPGDPYQDPSRTLGKRIGLMKGVVGTASSLLFYGTFGRFCFGSSLVAQGLKE